MCVLQYLENAMMFPVPFADIRLSIDDARCHQLGIALGTFFATIGPLDVAAMFAALAAG